MNLIRRSLPLILAAAALAAGCAVPRLIWPQKDIAGKQAGDAGAEKKVLIASRSSEYKDALVAKLEERYLGSGVFLNIIGIDGLEEYTVLKYDAVLIINTCMAWGMDRQVTAFVDKFPDNKNIIVYTTAGDPEWLPEMDGRHFDAVSGASVMADVDKKAAELAGKIDALLE